MKIKTLLWVVCALCLATPLFAQEATYSKINLTAEYDQIRFLVPGANSYYLMSKTLNNDAALGLYSSNDGGWLWRIQSTSGNMILHRGRIGVGTISPTAGLHVVDNNGIKVDDEQTGHEGVIKMTDGFTDAATRDDMTFESNGAFLFRLDRNGNGISNIKGFGIFDANDNNIFFAGLNGKVGIGTMEPGSFKLAVEGKIGAREVQVTATTPWPDYVFSEGYNLTPLQDLETYLKENKHLPGIPDAKTVEEEGINLGEMNTRLLEKVEELTLYVIDLNEEVQMLKQNNELLAEQNDLLKQQVEQLRSEIKSK